MKIPSIWVYRLGIAATVIIWGVNFPVLKYALAEMPPVVLNAIRMSFAVFLLGAIYLRRRARLGLDPWPLIRRYAGKILALGLLGHVIYQFGFIFGIPRTSSGNAALIMSFAPFWTALLGVLASTEKLSGIAWTGLSASIVGTAIVVVAGNPAHAPGGATLTTS